MKYKREVGTLVLLWVVHYISVLQIKLPSSALAVYLLQYMPQQPVPNEHRTEDSR